MKDNNHNSDTETKKVNVIKGLDRIFLIVAIIFTMIFSYFEYEDWKNIKTERIGISNEFDDFIYEKYKKNIPLNTTDIRKLYKILNNNTDNTSHNEIEKWINSISEEFYKKNNTDKIYKYNDKYIKKELKNLIKTIPLVFLILISSLMLLSRIIIFTSRWIINGFTGKQL